VPELPEVETTRRGIEPHVVGRRITMLRVHDRRLRWPVDLGMVPAVTGSAIRRAGRRAKYLLLETEAGTLILAVPSVSSALTATRGTLRFSGAATNLGFKTVTAGAEPR
jgi:formamidopyrimidine-DNA glycosylase